MRIVDAVTFHALVRNEPDRKMLVQRFSDNQFTTYHFRCLIKDRLENMGRAITGTQQMYAVYLLDEIGPQPRCRDCESESLT